VDIRDVMGANIFKFYVTPAFYKNRFFANIEVHIGCISMYPAYKNLSKNNLA
jgi:hypothetical protein